MVIPRPLLPLGLLLLGGCPKKGGSPARPADQWVNLADDFIPGMCMSAPTFRLDPEQQRAWQLAISALSDQQLEVANEHFAALGADYRAGPAISAAVANPGAAEPAQALIDLAKAHPDDPCLSYSAGYTAGIRADAEQALPLLRAAVDAYPGRSEPIAMQLVVQIKQGTDEAATSDRLDAALDRFPDDLFLRMIRAGLRQQRADYAGTAEDLAYVAHLNPTLQNAYVDALRRSENLPDYLRYASGQGWPLGDDGALATADDPVAAFAEILGVGPTDTLTATIETSEGSLECDLRWKEAPVTVGSFVGLATGKQAWTDPRTGEAGRGALYNDTVLHRVIPDFMIQGGDPTGTGSGGPGYRFLDETVPLYTMDRPGLLAMANSGPGTNGSQWFITEVPLTYLDGKHTVFGVCTAETVEVVKDIARRPRDAADRPQERVIVERILIEGK